MRLDELSLVMRRERRITKDNSTGRIIRLCYKDGHQTKNAKTTPRYERARGCMQRKQHGGCYASYKASAKPRNRQ